MIGVIAVTDHDWYDFLRRQGPLDEVNFWRPSDTRTPRQLSAGTPFVLKLRTRPVELRGVQRRRIPTLVKLEVWKRDRGRCTICGATDELHFDHIVPFLKGGASSTADNIQLLCARHNLAKHDRIE
jgi:hypothetical protein